MLSVLADRTYRHLFCAQVIALVGTGLMTVALGLLAYKIAGDKAGAVLVTALAIKMVAYVGVAPVVGGFANRLPRRPFLVSMDLVRALVAFALPFADQVWQVYVLIFVLQSASAAFTIGVRIQRSQCRSLAPIYQQKQSWRQLQVFMTTSRSSPDVFGTVQTLKS